MRNKHFRKGINLIRLNPFNYRHFAFLFILLNSIMGVNNAIQAQCTPATLTFKYTGGVQDFVVPNSINRITFSATGADGGDGGGTTGNGGSGGSINASFSVSPGDNIRLIVGQAGESTFWGGGGGGTAVINCGNPANCATGTLLIVAGGGGGGRGNNPGGGATAVAGSGAAGSNDVGGGGGGGVNGGGGVSFDGAQASKTSISAGGFGGNVSNGGKGFGGGGALQSIPGGGGGGGGYTGGNGTIDFGYGGSNYVDASAIAGFNNTAGIDGGSGGNNTNGVVVLSYTCPDPCLAFTNNRAYVNAAVTSSGDGSSWATAFKTLQEALTLNCPSITQIWVAQGTYSPTTTANRTISFVMKNGLAIYGGFDGTENSLFQRNWETNVTTLSGSIGGGESSYHVINNFYTSSNQLSSSAILDGFTVTGGLANGSSAREDVGGGMHNEYASPTIKNCVFTGNNAQFAGGGICNLNSAASISNCTFSNNSASNYEGGGIFNYSPNAFPYLYASVTNSTFTNNSARSGGGISNRGSLFGSSSTSNGRGPSITYCTFTDNSVSSYGGGISADSIDPTVTHCVFTGNTAGSFGGGLFSGHASKGATHCSFSDNSATKNGGGIYAYSNNFSSAYVNCSFSGNTAQNGGGMYVTTQASLVNCSFSGNSASLDGGGLWMIYYNKIKNCILWGNSSEIYIINPSNLPTDITYSIIKQASGVFPGTGNINADPLFISAADLHLQNGSPAINAGTATGAPGDDFDGDARPLGGGFDMGYDESTYIPPVCNLIVATHPSVTNSVCSGNSVTLTAKATATGSMTVKWQRKGVNDADYSDVTTTTTYTSGTNTDYTITAISTDDNNAMYRAVFASSACTNPVNTNAVTLSVNPNLTPSVSLGVSPSTTICAGTSVTFTATPTNGGTTPQYKWTINNQVQAETGTMLTRSNLANNDVVKVEMTSNATCASPTTTSDMKTMTVNPLLTPSVSLGVSTGTTICAGTSVIFTATPTNGGTTPTYKWTIGTTVQAETGATLTRSNLANNDVVKVELTSNATCVSPTTATDMNTMTVNPILTPSVSLGVSPSTTICAGTSVTFTATPTNGGTTPTYKWTIGTTVQAETGATLTRSNLANNDVVKVEMTSYATCASPTTTSDMKTMTVNPIITPSVSLGVSTGTTICAGTSVIFTATPTNGGTTPTYKWTIGTTVQAETGATLTRSNLANNDVVKVEMTSNALCLSTPTATATKTMVVSPTISVDAGATCLQVYSGYDAASGCTTLTATASGNGTTGYTFKWSTNATTPSINVCPTVNTSYTVTATKGACSATDKVDVKVLNVSCDKNKTQVCHNGLTVCIAKKDVPFHLAHGDKLGTCGANNLCGNSNALIANEKTHALSDKMDAELAIQLYPNPSYQVVTLQMDNIREGVVQFDIMDLAGRIIQHSQQRVDEGFSIITLDLQDLSKGLYIVRVKDKENREAFVKLSKL